MSTRKKIVVTIAALVAFTIAAIAMAYETEIEPIRSRLLACGSIAETPMGKVEYGLAGSGTPLLSIHGAGGGYDQGLLIAKALLGDKFRIIAPSRFGYLRTPVPPDGSSAAQADMHAALLDVLGIDRAIVVGTSAGAPSATQLALRHPEKVSALILISPAGYTPGRPVGLDSTRGNRSLLKIVRAGSDFAYWSIVHVAPSIVIRFIGVPTAVLENASPDDRQWATKAMDSILPLSARVAGIENDSLIHLDAWPLDRISAPTLIISSSDDLWHTQPAAEYAAAHIPGSQLIVYPTGGHLLIGHSADVRDAIGAFLQNNTVRLLKKSSPSWEIESCLPGMSSLSP